MRTSKRESGQAAVETAITMPLFVFILLAVIQLSLMHQARLMTKYAAYKAVRAGALNRGQPEVITNAAIAVMTPFLTKSSPIYSGSGSTQPQYALYQPHSASEYADAFKDVAQSRANKESSGKPIVEVTVCHPLSSDVDETKDFDDPATNPLGGNNDWRGYEATKLSLQVTTYFKLIIPFANAFLWWASLGKMDQQRVDTMKMIRLSTGANNTMRKTFKNQEYTLDTLKSEAEAGNYIMPIRASYSMRMQSNFSDKSKLPSENKCHIPFDRKE